MQEVKKIDEIDAGPMLIYPILKENDFKHFQFQESALKYLSISIVQNMALRYAIYCPLEKTAESSVWHTFAEASLPSFAESEDEDKMNRLVGEKNWVKAKEGLTGIVHQELKNHSIQYCKLNGQLQLVVCMEEGKFEFGFSCEFDPSKKRFIIIFRSTMQFKEFEIGTAPKYANYYSENTGFDKNTEECFGRVYTDEFHIKRTPEKFIMDIFADSFTRAINQYLQIHHPDLVQQEWVDYDATYLKNYTLKFHKSWQEMRHNKSLLGAALFKTFYISSCLREDQSGPFWPKEGDEDVARECIRLFLKYDIPFNPDEILSIITEFTSKTALIQACRKESFEGTSFVKLLINHGADIYAKEKGGATAFHYATEDTLELLNTIHQLIQTIKEGDKQKINAFFKAEKLRFIDQPVYKGMTPLALSMKNNSLEAALPILKLLEDNKVDFRSSKKRPLC